MVGSIVEDRAVATNEDTRNRLAIYGTPVNHSVAPGLFDIIFPALGLPAFQYTAEDCATLSDPKNKWSTDMARPCALGSCITMPLKIEAMSHVDEMTPTARAVGSINTTYFRTLPSGETVHVGDNIDTEGVRNPLLTALTGIPSPFPPTMPRSFAPNTAAGLMIGGGGAARAAIFALAGMAVSPIFLVNRDPVETAAIVDQFKQLDIRPLEDVDAARAALAELDRSGTRLAVSVGAIPSVAPQTDAEKMVYATIEAIFSHVYDAAGVSSKATEFVALPAKPVHLEMAYKPRMTLIRQIAEKHGWQTLCGVEAVLEVCFEQCYAWTGRVVPLELKYTRPKSAD
ncbi:3-dehydroquinate synthase [Pseudohyphozyma bogoriensis]|nr:3-dehydroquinate synthase [Pseudohyphozyma bogoriensis]